MHKTHQSKRITEAKYSQQLSQYRQKNHQGYSLLSQSYKTKGNQSIERNHNLKRHKKVRKLLNNKKVIAKRKQRTTYIEFLFTQLKHNHGFRRFSLKALEKLKFRLMAIANNLKRKSLHKNDIF